MCGFLSSFKSVNALWINNVAITMGGIATMLSGLYITEAFQFTYAGIFGIAIGEYRFQMNILLVSDSVSFFVFFLHIGKHMGGLVTKTHLQVNKVQSSVSIMIIIFNFSTVFFSFYFFVPCLFCPPFSIPMRGLGHGRKIIFVSA